MAVTNRSRTTCIPSAGVLAMATLMSVAVLANAPGGAGLALSGSGQSRTVWRGATNDEDATGWIHCLTQAAKSLRGRAPLPERIAAGAMVPLQTRVCFAWPVIGSARSGADHLRRTQPVLHCHLIDLPPPVCA